MKSSGQKEESADKKKYVFFSDPDVIAKRAETSAIVSNIYISCSCLNPYTHKYSKIFFITGSTDYKRCTIANF